MVKSIYSKKAIASMSLLCCVALGFTSCEEGDNPVSPATPTSPTTPATPSVKAGATFADGVVTITAGTTKDVNDVLNSDSVRKAVEAAAETEIIVSNGVEISDAIDVPVEGSKKITLTFNKEFSKREKALTIKDGHAHILTINLPEDGDAVDVNLTADIATVTLTSKGEAVIGTLVYDVVEDAYLENIEVETINESKNYGTIVLLDNASIDGIVATNGYGYDADANGFALKNVKKGTKRDKVYAQNVKVIKSTEGDSDKDAYIYVDAKDAKAGTVTIAKDASAQVDVNDKASLEAIVGEGDKPTAKLNISGANYVGNIKNVALSTSSIGGNIEGCAITMTHYNFSINSENVKNCTFTYDLEEKDEKGNTLLPRFSIKMQGAATGSAKVTFDGCTFPANTDSFYAWLSGDEKVLDADGNAVTVTYYYWWDADGNYVKTAEKSDIPEAILKAGKDKEGGYSEWSYPATTSIDYQDFTGIVAFNKCKIGTVSANTGSLLWKVEAYFDYSLRDKTTLLYEIDGTTYKYVYGNNGSAFVKQ